MGTKRELASHVRELAAETATSGRVADLFSGIGAVVDAFADHRAVIANDLLTFTSCLARARFKAGRRKSVTSMVRLLEPTYTAAFHALAQEYADAVAADAEALASGDWQTLQKRMAGTPHAGSSAAAQAAVLTARDAEGPTRYRLATLYFAGGYFSTKQAIQIDALRYAIDSQPSLYRDWLLAAWLAAAGVGMNAPGHAAQFLRCHDAVSGARVRRAWHVDIWKVFASKLDAIGPCGSAEWRRNNIVTNYEARDVLKSRLHFGLVYADPPYTKDQYSRYYHVYETLYRYDFPDSRGLGRYRDDRFVSDFSMKRTVLSAFDSLCERTAARRVPLILSYPSNGLLMSTGTNLEELLHSHFSRVTVRSIDLQHSTLGARSGHQKKPATENLYVCSPN